MRVTETTGTSALRARISSRLAGEPFWKLFHLGRRPRRSDTLVFILESAEEHTTCLPLIARAAATSLTNTQPECGTWDLYLSEMSARNLISPTARQTGQQIWNKLKQFNPHLAEPTAAPIEESRGLFLSWDADQHHIEIEIMPSGKYEWFYRNRSTAEFTGGEDHSVDELPPDLLTKFSAAITANR